MTKVMLARCSILAWQSFIWTSYSLSFKLVGIIPDKPIAVVAEIISDNHFSLAESC